MIDDVELKALMAVAALDASSWERVRQWGDARHTAADKLPHQSGDWRGEIRAWHDDERGKRATERYRQLVMELGAAMGSRYGWKCAVARRLDVHPSYISKVVAGELNCVGFEVLERAVECIGVEPSYFVCPDDAPLAMFLPRREGVNGATS